MATERFMGLNVSPGRLKLVKQVQLGKIQWSPGDAGFVLTNGGSIHGRHERELREMKKAGWTFYQKSLDPGATLENVRLTADAHDFFQKYGD